jgi:hypothetical protein
MSSGYPVRDLIYDRGSTGPNPKVSCGHNLPAAFMNDSVWKAFMPMCPRASIIGYLVSLELYGASMNDRVKLRQPTDTVHVCTATITGISLPLTGAKSSSTNIHFIRNTICSCQESLSGNHKTMTGC